MNVRPKRARPVLRQSLVSVLSTLWAAMFLAGASMVSAAPPTLADTVRFLEQATFGPTPELITLVQKIGFEAFLKDQFNQPLPDYPDLGYWPQRPTDDCRGECRLMNYTVYPLQVRFFQNALTAPDQLRQRVAFALNQIFVVSAQDNVLRQPSRMLPYLKILDSQAFGNFRTLLTDITLNAAMGAFLDTVGNRAVAPNENYARELLQLFTIGVNDLNPDGTSKLDADGDPLPTYTQEAITAFARVFTGWVFAPEPQLEILNFFEPMVPGPPRLHDTDEKKLLNGVILPAERSAQQDLQDALDNIFAHPNVAPFISRNLIQHLVTSNPTPAYVGRAVAEISGRAVANSLALNADPVINTAFPESQLGNELKQIAKFIKFSRDLGIKRQIFFCSLGGFDTHSNQGGETGTQANLLRDVSDSMGTFYDATVELGVSSHVTTFTMSDFSRTFKPAGAGAAIGTDHAWGSHQFALGDAVTGGDFYGHYPNLALSGPDDTDEGANARGRWIPTTAVDQYAATLALWFGVSSGDLSLVFPNIGHFGTTDLGFLQ